MSGAISSNLEYAYVNFEDKFGTLAPSERPQKAFWTTLAKLEVLQRKSFAPFFAQGADINPPTVIFSPSVEGTPCFIKWKDWRGKWGLRRIGREIGFRTNLYQYFQLPKLYRVIRENEKLIEELSHVHPSSLSELRQLYTRLLGLQTTTLLSHWFVETGTLEDEISSKRCTLCLSVILRIPQFVLHLSLAPFLSIASGQGPCTALSLGPMIFPILKLRKMQDRIHELLNQLLTTSFYVGKTLLPLASSDYRPVQIAMKAFLDLSHLQLKEKEVELKEDSAYLLDGNGNPRSTDAPLSCLTRFIFLIDRRPIATLDLAIGHQRSPHSCPLQWASSVEGEFPICTIISNPTLTEDQKGNRPLRLALYQFLREIEQKEHVDISTPTALFDSLSPTPEEEQMVYERIHKEPLLSPHIKLHLHHLYELSQEKEISLNHKSLIFEDMHEEKEGPPLP
ncbi:MAG: hypothetical protein KGJ02_01580 [Verrucomicrobiota bacterium]|nr:hypothetical protein [Verrucomicrobiota bacterium]